MKGERVFTLCMTTSRVCGYAGMKSISVNYESVTEMNHPAASSGVLDPELRNKFTLNRFQEIVPKKNRQELLT
ncbi:MAG: hypothetical protein D3904_07535 [Candidatus Electrothrix sp. EH2]|nr:hypothetical protein [Candidatus Electrothrix sp. EH2]